MTVFFGLGVQRGVTPHGPAMGGTPWPGSALRAVVRLFTSVSGCLSVIVSSFALCPGGMFKKMGILSITPLNIYYASYFCCFRCVFVGFRKLFRCSTPWMIYFNLFGHIIGQNRHIGVDYRAYLFRVHCRSLY